MAPTNRNEAFLFAPVTDTGAAVSLGFALFDVPGATSPTIQPRIASYPVQLYSAAKASNGQLRLTGGPAPATMRLELDNHDEALGHLASYCWHGSAVTHYELQDRRDGLASAYRTATWYVEGEPIFNDDRGTVDVALRGREIMGDEPYTARYSASPVALRFPEPSGNRVELPAECDVRIYQSWAIECWCRPESFLDGSAYHGLIGFVDPGAGQNLQLMAGSTASTSWNQSLSFNMPGLASGVADSILTDGKAHHVAMICTGRRVLLMVDGVVEHDGGFAGFSPSAQTQGTVYFATISGGSRRFVGDLWGLRLWKAAPTWQEIAERRYDSVTDDQRLLAQYLCNEGAQIDIAGSRGDSHIFDSATVPAGVGYGVVIGSPTWELVEGIRDGAERRMRRVYGQFRGVKGDPSDPRSHAMQVSDEPIMAVDEVESGGRLQKADRLRFSGSGSISVADHASLDWGSGELRYFRVVFRPADAAVNHSLVYHSAGGVTWAIDLTAVTGSAGSGVSENAKGGSGQLLQVDVEFTNGSGTATISSQRYYDAGSVLTIDVRGKSNSGALQLIVNGSQEGSAALPAGALSPAGTWYVCGDGASRTATGDLYHFEYGSAPIRPNDEALFQKANPEGVADGTPAMLLAVDEGSGSTLTDTSANSNNGTISGGTWVNDTITIVNGPRGCIVESDAGAGGPLRVSGRGWLPLGHAVQVDSTSTAERAAAPDAADLRMTGSFTCFVRYFHAADHPTFAYPFYKFSTGVAGSWTIQTLNGNLVRAVLEDDGGTRTTPSASLEVGRWYWLFLVFSENNYLRIVIDGSVEGEQSTVSTISTNATTAPVLIAAGVNGGRCHHAGMINRELTEQEIFEVMSDPHGWIKARPTEPVAYWPTWENEGTKANDMSTYGNPAALTSGCTWAPGEYPETASAIARWVAMRHGGVRWDEIDESSLDDFEKPFGSAKVNHVAREETPAETVSKLLAPHGTWGFDLDGKLRMRQLLPPNVGRFAVVGEDLSTNYYVVGGTGTFPQDERPMTAFVSFLSMRWDSAQAVLVGAGTGGGSENWVIYITAAGNLAFSFVDAGGTERIWHADDALDTDVLNGTDGKMHRVAVSKSGQMWIDRVEVATTEQASGSKTYSSSPPSYFGVRPGFAADGFHGIVGEHAVYQRNMTDAEVQAHWTVKPTAATTWAQFGWSLRDLGDFYEESVGGLTSLRPALGTGSDIRLVREGLIDEPATIEESFLTTLQNSVRGVKTSSPQRVASVLYSRMWDPYDEGDLIESTTESPGYQERLLRRWLTVDPAATVVCGLAEQKLQVETPYVTRSDALLSGQVLATRFGTVRRSRSIGFSPLQDVSAGQSVRWSYDNPDSSVDAYGLPEGGRVFLVLQVSRVWLDDSQTLTVWR